MKTGIVQYTSNAFQQDGELAIKNDIVVALLELITNADDAYGLNQGPIQVTISELNPEAGTIDVSVQDRAKGLHTDDLEKKFAVLGGENQQFLSGEQSRGLLGRGAKDVASLGAVTFSTIKDGVFSTLRLERNAHYTQEDSIPAENKHRAALGLGPDENGLTAVIHVDVKGLGIKLPKPNKLKEKISTHAQLRDLLDRREVIFLDMRSKNGASVLRYEKPKSTEIFNETFEIPGYPGEVTLVINRLSEYSKKMLTPYSDHGILVKSGITIYENSGFGQEGHPSIGFISGHLVAPRINDLIREYDQDKTLEGGRLIRRDRDGLVKTHPFTIALTTAVQARLNPILQEIQSESAAQGGQGEGLTRALKDAAKALQKDVLEILEELDREASARGEVSIPAIAAIPPELKIPQNGMKSLTIRISGTDTDDLTAAISSADHDELVAIENPEPTKWKPHPRLDASLASLEIIAGEELGHGLLVIDGKWGSVSVPISVVSPLHSDPEPVRRLEFKSPEAKIAPTKTRALEVRAPISQSDEEVFITCGGIEIADFPKSVILRPAEHGQWSSAFVRIKTTKELGSLLVTANDASGNHAQCKLFVEEGGPQGGPGLEFELVRGRNYSNRVTLYDDKNGLVSIQVHTDHQAFGGVFGKYDEAKKSYENEDSPEARQVLAEVLSRILAEHFTVELSLKDPDEFTDGPRFFAKCHELTERFLKAFNATLKGN